MEFPETLETKQTISLVAFKSLPGIIRLARHCWQINRAIVAFCYLVSGLIYFRSVVDLYYIARITQLSKAPLNCVLPPKLKSNELKCECQSSRFEKTLTAVIFMIAWMDNLFLTIPVLCPCLGFGCPHPTHSSPRGLGAVFMGSPPDGPTASRQKPWKKCGWYSSLRSHGSCANDHAYF